MPTALAIDTTSADLSLAVGRAGAAPALFHERVGVKATARLFDELHRLLQGQGLTVGDVELLLVAIGPGSFTGTRIGMAVAATLGQVLGRPVIGVDCLQLLAAQTAPPGAGDAAGPPGEVFHAVLNCARDEVYHAPFRWERGVPRAQAPIGMANFAALPKLVGGAPAVVRRFDPHSTEGSAALSALTPAPLRHARPDATLLLELGLARLAERPGGPFPPPEPIYLKPEAFRRWRP